MDVVEEPLRSEHERRDCFAAMQRFARPVDHTFFHQVDNAVGTHLGVNAEIVLVFETMEDRFRDPTDSRLERGAIGNERGYMPGDVEMHLGAGFGSEFEQRARGFNERRYPADVNGCVTVGARSAVIHLGDHRFGAADCRQCAVDRCAEAHETVSIRRRYLHQHNVKRQSAGLEEAFNFAEKDGSVVGASLSDSFANVIAEKESAMTEVALVFGTRVGRLAQSLHVDEFDVDQFGRAGHQGVD
ncbi:MAG TPA: hypothetical protein VGI45_16455 [Terracidiphilus sp.]